MGRNRTIADPNEFVEFVQANKEPFVVMFCATWCPFCQNFKQIFEPRKSEFKLDVVTVVLDELDNPLWDQFSVEVVPTLAVFSNGRILKRINGVLGIGLGVKDVDELVGFTRSIISSQH